jgi:hypothetical protein
MVSPDSFIEKCDDTKIYDPAKPKKYSGSLGFSVKTGLVIDIKNSSTMHHAYL